MWFWTAGLLNRSKSRGIYQTTLKKYMVCMPLWMINGNIRWYCFVIFMYFNLWRFAYIEKPMSRFCFENIAGNDWYAFPWKTHVLREVCACLHKLVFNSAFQASLHKFTQWQKNQACHIPDCHSSHWEEHFKCMKPRFFGGHACVTNGIFWVGWPCQGKLLLREENDDWNLNRTNNTFFCTYQDKQRLLYSTNSRGGVTVLSSWWPAPPSFSCVHGSSVTQ